jgi:hypothetical protein
VAAATSFEVFCRDFFEKKWEGITEAVAVDRLTSITNQNLCKELKKHIKTAKQLKVPVKEYVSAQFSFQKFNSVVSIFSALAQEDFPKKIGVSEEVLNNITCAWELRHRLVHDVNLKMSINDDRLLLYMESMRRFAQLTSWKGYP